MDLLVHFVWQPFSHAPILRFSHLPIIFHDDISHLFVNTLVKVTKICHMVYSPSETVHI